MKWIPVLFLNKAVKISPSKISSLPSVAYSGGLSFYC